MPGQPQYRLSFITKVNTMQRENTPREQAENPWKRRFVVLLIVLVGIPAFVGLMLLRRFAGDMPVDYASPTEHFKYGSTGGEHEMGFPYWIWKALPEICPQYLPGKGYQSLGMVYEKSPDGSDKDLPIGTSKRRFQGIDRVFVNCAVCHTSTVCADSQPFWITPAPPRPPGRSSKRR